MRAIILSLFCSISIVSSAQRADTMKSSKSLYGQVGIGIATTNFDYPEGWYLQKTLLFFHADAFLIKNFTPRFDTRIGVAYEPVGYTYTTSLGNNQSYFTKVRLFYGNLHLITGYRLNKPMKRVDVRLLTGIFAGRLLDQDIVSLLRPENKTFESKAISTYRLWNGGISFGLSTAIAIKQDKAIGVKLVASPGLTNIFIPEATEMTGIKRFTRSIILSTFFHF